MFDKVASLLHDLDEGMRPLSVIAPHFPTAYHRKRDKCVCCYFTCELRRRLHNLYAALSGLHVYWPRHSKTCVLMSAAAVHKRIYWFTWLCPSPGRGRNSHSFSAKSSRPGEHPVYRRMMSCRYLCPALLLNWSKHGDGLEQIAAYLVATFMIGLRKRRTCRK